MQHFLILALVSVLGKTWNVPGDCENIQAAIDASTDGDIVLVSAGTWKERIAVSNKTITISSVAGAEATVIHGGNDGTVVSYTNNSNGVIEGFTIRGGAAELGGGAYIENSSPTFQHCLVDFNAAKQGGGAYVLRGTPVFSQCCFSFNTAEDGDGIWAKLARPELTACIFAGDSIGWQSGEMVTVRDTNSPAGACCIRDVCIQTASVACWEAGGLYRGESSTCIEACDAVCDEDVTGDGVVNLTDVLRVISAFGFCP
tara:strand:- start:189 stop:959 length:771 start_codon:yes stop_codon:yes gene_type:complete